MYTERPSIYEEAYYNGEDLLNVGRPTVYGGPSIYGEAYCIREGLLYTEANCIREGQVYMGKPGVKGEAYWRPTASDFLLTSVTGWGQSCTPTDSCPHMYTVNMPGFLHPRVALSLGTLTELHFCERRSVQFHIYSISYTYVCV